MRRNGLFLMSHVKEMWAALFEYHKQRCCGKRRVWGQGFLAQSPLPFPCVLWSLSHLALTPTCTRQAATQSNSSHSQDIIHLLFSTQLSLEQHGFELCGSTYTRIFFSPNKYVLWYYTTWDWLSPPIQRAGYKVTCRFPSVRRVSAQTPVLVKSHF